MNKVRFQPGWLVEEGRVARAQFEERTGRLNDLTVSISRRKTEITNSSVASAIARSEVKHARKQRAGD